MLIPVLNVENAVQVDDLTRFDASKSIATKGANPITSVKIAAGYGAADVEVFNADPEERVLDWVFTSQTFDIDSVNSLVLFKVGNTNFSTNVPDGVYSSLANLLTALKTVIEAVALPLTVSFSVGKDNRITLTPSNTDFALVLNQDPASLFDFLQFKDEKVLTSEPVEFSVKRVKLTVASSNESAVLYKYVKLFTADSDKLFSDDADLTLKERDILKWTSKGRASFLAEHRAAQGDILEWLYSNNLLDKDGKPLTKWSLVRTDDLRSWATYKVLADLFLSFSNAVDDEFSQKSEKYRGYEVAARNKYKLTIDTDGDGKPDDVQESGTFSGSLVHK